MNLLSIGAAYGVMVMVFQWGWGKDLIGLEATVPIIPFIPMFMFAIVFGLSMDYEVFLLSRVREEYLATGDNDTLGDPRHRQHRPGDHLGRADHDLGVPGLRPRRRPQSIKMFGIGLATAVFVDATIVRMVLVPATMKLMGDANWWIPAWLDRILPPSTSTAKPAFPSPRWRRPTCPSTPPSRAPNRPTSRFEWSVISR